MYNIWYKKATSFFNFFVFSHIWIGLCAVAQACITYLYFRIPPNGILLAMLFFSTFFVYNIRTVLQYPLIYQNRSVYESSHMQTVSRNLNGIIILAFLCLPTILFLSVFLSIKTLVLLFSAGIFSLAYFFPLPSNKPRKTLREVTGIKPVIIAFVWGLSTVLAPLNQAGIDLYHVRVLMSFTERFLFVFTLALVFDIRDITADQKRHLRTLAIYLGPYYSKVFCIVALGMEFLIVCYLKGCLHPDIWMGLCIYIFIVLLFLWRGFYHLHNDYYYLFLIDGLMLFQYPFLYLFQFILPAFR